jgi:hypothetical protein
MQLASSEIRAGFERWLALQLQAGTRLVVLEGLSNSGKSYLTAEPFILGECRSINIEMDDFLLRPVLPTTAYDEAIDRSAMKARLANSLEWSPLVVIQAVIAWPLVHSVVNALGPDRVRRVYLKRMMRLNPDIWVDESHIFNNERWPTAEYYRSIWHYHAEQHPWRGCDLVLKRVESEEE